MANFLRVQSSSRGSSGSLVLDSKHQPRVPLLDEQDERRHHHHEAEVEDEAALREGEVLLKFEFCPPHSRQLG